MLLLRKVIVVAAKLAEGALYPVSVDEVSNPPSFTVYPNPTSGSVRISGVVGGSGTVLLQIYNAVGQVVLSKTYNTKKLDEDMQLNLPDGLYHIVLSADGYKSVKPLVVSR